MGAKIKIDPAKLPPSGINDRYKTSRPVKSGGSRRTVFKDDWNREKDVSGYGGFGTLMDPFMGDGTERGNDTEDLDGTYDMEEDGEE